MTPPIIYTETSLAEFMLAELAGTADGLGLTLGDLAEAVNETMLVYGVTNIASATDIRKLRSIARVEAWKVVINQVTGDYDYSDAGASYSRSQMQAAAEKRLQIALSDAAQYYPAYQVGTATVDFPDNPYKRPDYTLLGGV